MRDKIRTAALTKDAVDPANVVRVDFDSAITVMVENKATGRFDVLHLTVSEEGSTYHVLLSRLEDGRMKGRVSIRELIDNIGDGDEPFRPRRVVTQENGRPVETWYDATAQRPRRLRDYNSIQELRDDGYTVNRCMICDQPCSDQPGDKPVCNSASSIFMEMDGGITAFVDPVCAGCAEEMPKVKDGSVAEGRGNE